jgi:glycosyltransferase involved in cell wall biosynthesis
VIDKDKVFVLIVTPQLTTGGAENQVVTLAKALKKLGYSPLVLSSGGENENELQKAGVLHIKAPVNGKDVVSIIKSIIAIRRLLSSYGVSIIHCHAVVPALTGRIAAIGRRVPVICTGHGWPLSRMSSVARILKYSVDHLIAISQSMKNEFVTRGFPEKKISVIHNSIAVEPLLCEYDPEIRYELKATPDDILLGVISRISEELKGHMVLFKAMRIIINEFHNIKLAVVGDGVLRNDLESKVKEMGLIDYVHFAGNRLDIHNIYATLDIVIIPSLREGLPIVALEAMAAGKPLIATAVDGTVEAVVDGKTGVLVPPNDVDALVKAIRTVATNYEDYILMGVVGRNHVNENFNPLTNVQNIIDLYKQYIGKII